MVQTQIPPSSTSAQAGKYSPEQLAWLDKAKAFAKAISLQEVMDSDKENVFRRDLFEKACQPEWGLGGLPFVSTYGGSAGDYVYHLNSGRADGCSATWQQGGITCYICICISR